MLFDEVMEEPDQNRTVLNMIKKIFSQFWGLFFMDQDPDFLPIRIRTQEKESDPDPDKRTRIRFRNTD